MSGLVIIRTWHDREWEEYSLVGCIEVAGYPLLNLEHAVPPLGGYQRDEWDALCHEWCESIFAAIATGIGAL